MNKLHRTNSENKDFQNLVFELDKYLAKINSDDNDFFVQFNKIDLLNHAVVAYSNNLPIGCGAIKKLNSNSMEIKRMFVPESMRGKGIASAILNELENWTKELGFEKCVLETSNKMHDAIGLYTKCGYKIIPNYGQYEQIKTSVCFEKIV